MQIAINIIVTLFVFAVLIFSHEAGHFFAAKACKIKVNEFSLGMGPAIFKKQGRETLYSLRLLPIGGYCQMDGEDGDGENTNSFNKKPHWQRFLVLVMGALMNILLGFILICIINSFSERLPTTIVAQFEDNSISNSCGLQIDDKIIKINNYGINSFLDLSYALSTSGTNPVTVTVRRNDSEVIIQNVTFPVSNDPTIGDYFDLDFKVYGVKRSFLSNIKYSFDWTVSISKSIYSFFGTMFTGKADINQVSGPVGTTVAIGESVKSGVDSLLLVMALISINLGIVNLLPFPALDGGRIVLLFVEAIRKKPLHPKIEGAINAVGLIVLLVLMALIMIKDIINLF